MESMKAGREMDALVAEKVMGWKCSDRNCDGTKLTICGACGAVDHGNCFGPGRGGQIQITCEEAGHRPNYSTSIADAWQVVEKLKDRGFNLWKKFDGTGYFCHFHIPGSYAWGYPQSEAETASHAICLAALKAVGAL